MTDLLDLMGAAESGREGANRALDHANAVMPLWGDRALSAVRAYANSHDRFLTEDIRAWAHSQGLPRPPDSRAWGGVISRAVKAGWLVGDGFGRTKYGPGHARPMAIWQSRLCPRPR